MVNIKNVTTLNGKTNVAKSVGTGGTVVVSAVAANDVLKVNSVYASNRLSVDTLCSVFLTRSSVDYGIATSITVPVGTTLDVLSNSVYLEAGDSLKVKAGDASGLDVVVSYEEITDQ